MSNVIGTQATIFMVNDAPAGLRSADLGLSAISAYFIPQASLSLLSSNPFDILGESSGVYFLVWHDGHGEKEKMYIGSSMELFERISKHEKKGWGEAIVLTTKDHRLNRAHIEFLEEEFYSLCNKFGSYKLINERVPKYNGNLSIGDKSNMRKFIEESRVLIKICGYELFEHDYSRNEVASDEFFRFAPSYVHEGNKFNILDATMFVDRNEGCFVIKKGSEFNFNEPNKSLQENYKNRRKQLVESGAIDLDAGVFKKDVEFNSISECTLVITGKTQYGATDWKNNKDQTYDEWLYSKE